MTSDRARLTVLLVFALFAGGGARADDPGPVYDATGQMVENVEENGVRVQYIYDGHGDLVEARYSDGRTVSYPPHSDASSERSAEN